MKINLGKRNLGRPPSKLLLYYMYAIEITTLYMHNENAALILYKQIVTFF